MTKAADHSVDLSRTPSEGLDSRSNCLAVLSWVAEHQKAFSAGRVCRGLVGLSSVSYCCAADIPPIPPQTTVQTCELRGVGLQQAQAGTVQAIRLDSLLLRGIGKGNSRELPAILVRSLGPAVDADQPAAKLGIDCDTALSNSAESSSARWAEALCSYAQVRTFVLPVFGVR